jgi:hypothetical protein
LHILNFLILIHVFSSFERFNQTGDYQIRLNDHPYAFTPDITHLVVWSAVSFPSDVTSQDRSEVYEKFVFEHFGEMAPDRRCWFLNWGSIQSVPGLEVRYAFPFD